MGKGKREAGLWLAEPGNVITSDLGVFGNRDPPYQNTRNKKYKRQTALGIIYLNRILQGQT